jgi:hypothetical protein
MNLDFIKKKKFLGIFIILFGLTFSQSFAAEVIFDSTDQSYSAGDIVDLTGNIRGGIEGDLVAIEIKSPSGEVILIRTVELGPEGSYSLKFRIPPSGESGTYGITTNVAIEETSKTTTSQNEFDSQPYQNTQTTSDNGGGCLIATATYGSELAPQVQQLRELRDNSLLTTESGTNFMGAFNDFYYSFSPYIADYERENPIFREMVKVAITPMITSLSILNYVDMNSETEVLGYGISLILLNIGMYVGIPGIVIVGIRKKF